MNFSDFPLTETITAVIAAAIGWFTGGKLQVKSTEIDNTAKLIELWEKANHNCQKELDEMREEIRVVRAEAGAERERLNDDISKLQQKIKVMEAHIKKLESK